MDLKYASLGSETPDGSQERKPRLTANSMSSQDVDPPPTRSLAELIESLEERGRSVSDISYLAEAKTMMYGYMHLMDLYHSECFIAGHLTFYTDEGKLNYAADFLQKFTPRNIGKDLLKCIQSNTQVIFIPLQLKSTHSRVGHQNLLIYRPFKKTIERFEPQILESQPVMNAVLKTLFEETLAPKLGEHTPTYYPPQQICPVHAVGLQEVELLSRFDISLEGQGYCQIWSLFLIESILTNPEMDTADVIDECFRLSKSDPEYLRRMMRGYVEIISKAILEDSEFNIKLAKFSGKVPNITLQIQDAIDRAAFYKKRKPSATRKKGVSRRASPGDRAKVFNTIKRLSSEERFYLCAVFQVNGPCRASALMKRVQDLTPAQLADFVREAETLKNETQKTEEVKTVVWDILMGLDEPTLRLLATKAKAMNGLYVDIQRLHQIILKTPKLTVDGLKELIEKLRAKSRMEIPRI